MGVGHRPELRIERVVVEQDPLADRAGNLVDECGTCRIHGDPGSPAMVMNEFNRLVRVVAAGVAKRTSRIRR